MSGQRNAGISLGSERWLEAVWEPGARLYALPGGLEMLDVTGNGDPRLVCADLGTATTNSAKVSKLRVFRGGDIVTEHNVPECPSGVIGFHSENGDRGSAALAVAAGSSLYIYKNMRPYFKYCLPHVEAHASEREIWHRVGLEDDPNILTLVDDLKAFLKDLGASLVSPRTLKFLMLDANDRPSFVEQYRRIPLTRANVATSLGLVRRDAEHSAAASYLLVGTEFGQILVLDTRAFTIIERLSLGWTPVAMASCGMWNAEARVVAVGRDGRIGAARKGCATKLWDKLPAPAVSLASLSGEGIAIATMDSTLWGFSKMGVRLWKVELPNVALDTVGIPVPRRSLSLLAVSIAGHGVRIFDGKHQVDTINTMEPVSVMKYGRMGQEERAMAMVTVGGGLGVKILKRTADFGTRNDTASLPTGERFAIPKKTRLFVEQTIRERAEATKIHDSFHRGLARLRLFTCRKAFDELTMNQDSGPCSVVLDASIVGLGPEFLVKIFVTNISDSISDPGLFIVCRCENVDVSPRVANLPLLPSGVSVPLVITAISRNMLSGKIKIMLCKKDKAKPIALANVVVPAVEEEIDV